MNRKTNEIKGLSDHPYASARSPTVTFDNENKSTPNNWLFAGSLRAGQRAAAVMSLIQAARMNGHDPYAYLKDVLTRLPTHKASRIDELLPHRWQPSEI